MKSMNQPDHLPPLPSDVIALTHELLARRTDLESARDGLLRSCAAIIKAFTEGGPLYLCGNGGSFADAIHIKGELAKSFERKRPIRDPRVIEKLRQSALGQRLLEVLEGGMPVVVLGESHGLRSAFENDKSAEFSYAQELNSFIRWIKAGVWLGISTSGNAKNVLAAAALAKAYGLTTIGFTGPDGGQLAPQVEIPWRVPGDRTATIQENQQVLYHTLCRMIEVGSLSML